MQLFARKNKKKTFGLLAVPLLLFLMIDQVRPRLAEVGAFEEKEYEKSQLVALKALHKLDQDHRFARKLVIRWKVRFENTSGFYEVIYERGAQKMRYSVKFRGSDFSFNDDWQSNCVRVTSETIAKAAKKNDLSGLLFGDGCVNNFPRRS